MKRKILMEKKYILGCVLFFLINGTYARFPRINNCKTYHNFIKLEKSYCPQEDLEEQIKKGELLINDMLNHFNKKNNSCMENLGAPGFQYFTFEAEKILTAIIYYAMINNKEQYLEELARHKSPYINFLILLMAQNLKNKRWVKKNHKRKPN